MPWDVVGPRTNALGEVISPDQTVDPYLDVVVKLDNGNIVITTAYPSTVDLAIQLAVAQEALAKEMPPISVRSLERNSTRLGSPACISLIPRLKRWKGCRRLLNGFPLLKFRC